MKCGYKFKRRLKSSDYTEISNLMNSSDFINKPLEDRNNLIDSDDYTLFLYVGNNLVGFLVYNPVCYIQDLNVGGCFVKHIVAKCWGEDYNKYITKLLDILIRHLDNTTVYVKNNSFGLPLSSMGFDFKWNSDNDVFNCYYYKKV